MQIINDPVFERNSKISLLELGRFSIAFSHNIKQVSCSPDMTLHG